MFFFCQSKEIKRFIASKLLKGLEFYNSKEPFEITEIDLQSFFGFFLNHQNSPLKTGDSFFRDTASGFTVLFSGYIFNKIDVSEKLEINQSLSDPEFIFYAFQKHSLEFASFFNGDFAIAIYNEKKNELFLFRDHLGVRPLAYYQNHETFCFSNDILFLSQIFCAENVFNPEPFLGFFKQIDYTQLPSRDVRQLLPGHYLIFKEGRLDIKKYWFPERIEENKRMARATMLSEMKRLVQKAVRIRCDQRFTAASHVSGGLDCGIVSALARKEYKKQKTFYGFSWSSEGETPEKIDFDERQLVKEHCALNDITPVYSNFSEEDCLRFVSDPIRYSSYFWEQKVLEIANEKKINLIFSGHGGDEFISKNHRGIDSDLLFNGQWASFFKKNPINKPRALITRIFYEVFFPALKILPPSIKNSQKKSVRYLKTAYKKPHKKTLENFYFYTSRRQLHLGFFYCYYLNERMGEWYVRGQQAGVEYRYPLLDKEIVEFMLTIPSRLLFKDHFVRNILREISEGLLPESVRWKESGRDPSFEFFSQKVTTSCGQKIIKELSSFKENPALAFFDFDLFEKDYHTFFFENNEKGLASVYNYAVILKILDGQTKSYLAAKKENVS